MDAWKVSKEVDLANINSDVGELDINELKTVPGVLNNLKSKVSKLNVDKFQTFPVDLKILSEEALKNLATKKQDAFDLGDKYRSNLKTLKHSLKN